MDTGADPPRYRRLRKASDLRTAAAHPPPKRMRPSEEHTSFCEDKISSLPDEMLIMIVDKLDARTAITTSILSKRWRDLPAHSHTCYDLGVDDILPPRYHRLKQMVVEAKAGYVAEKNALNLAGCRGYTPQYDPAGDITRLGLGVSLMTRQTISRQEQLSRLSSREQVEHCNPADTVM
ncbi:putative F-box protein At5g40050 isoform X3 [Triticum aestivum]|uniref:putative F-box protein At5g40050 isoform X3 n=1 Tax=Triticum aestivum TaxID=4565 RepID=UPI001D02B21C|nr:putative F-box protein At5g40050 isoform X3 [Triticum aestivum]